MTEKAIANKLGQNLRFQLMKNNKSFDSDHTEGFAIEDILKNDDSYQELLRQLNLTKTDSYANAAFKIGIDDFLDKIKNKSKVLTGRKKPLTRANQKIFGKQLLIDLFIQCIEPVLDRQFNENDFVRMILLRAKLWPLRAGLIGASLNKSADLLNAEISFVDDFYLCSDYFRYAKPKLADEEISILEKNIKDACENLKTLSDILKIINRYDKPDWCRYCFRMAIVGSLYCGIHSPTADDSQYRKASKVNPNEDNVYKEYQYLRFMLGDQPKVVGLNEMISPHEDILCLQNETNQNIYRATLNGDWADIRKIWEKSIEIQLPCVADVIRNTGYRDANNWNDFVSEIFKGIGEYTDTVRHPYWVKRILELAEIWYFFEGKIIDRRQNDTKLKIAMYYESGMKQSEISKTLSISPAMVSKVIKKLYSQ